MITAQIESFEERLSELQPLLPLHHEELAIDPLEVPLDPKWDEYLALERAGRLLFVTVRKNGDLIGYFIGFYVESKHNDLRILAQDIFYIVKPERKGGAGTQLFDLVEAEFKRSGGGRWIVAEKVHLPAGPFFEAHGLRLTERSYWKMV